MDIISSDSNKLVIGLSKLKQSKYRKLNNEFIVETLHLIEEAKKYNYLKYIITCDLEFKDENVVYVTENIMKKLSSHSTFSKYIGICDIVAKEIDYDDHCLVLDNIQDPGNLGSILRNARAFNVHNIIVGDDCCDLFNHKVIQASQGAIFSLNILRQNLSEEIHNLRNKNYKLIGTSLDNSIPLSYDSKLDKKSAIVFGNEGQGIKKEILNELDFNYLIKMNDFDSLNVACANAIVLYQLFSDNCCD